jgi:uncharacterized protein (TIGR02453 family)
MILDIICVRSGATIARWSTAASARMPNNPTMNSQGFAGFSRAAIQFLAELTTNNERSWFQPRKADYERLVKEPMEALCVALAERFEARGIPLLADPRRSPFRIYRDTRFSRDKTPYKTHAAASFPWLGGGSGYEASGERAHGSGGYFSFAPGEMWVGGGMWRPPRPRLEAFRVAVRDQPERVRSALEDPGFTSVFGAAYTEQELKRVPPGYPADHSLADLLRWKDVLFSCRLSDSEVLSSSLPDTLAGMFAAAVPVLRFLANLP